MLLHSVSRDQETSLYATVSQLLPGLLAPENRASRDTARWQVRTAFLSDVHLGSRGCRAAELLEFLESVRMDELIIVGDLIDFWSLRRSFFWPAEHNAVLRAILGKAKRGTRVIYVPGNHDAEMREFVGSSFGLIEIQRDYVHHTASGERMLVLHGDEFDGVVKCSRWLAAFGSHVYDLTLELNRHFNRIRGALGYSYWSLASYLKDRVPNARQYIESFEHAVAHEARRRGVDGVVCGHIHRPQLRRIEGLLYCNDGDWVENCTALIEDRNGRLALWNWVEINAGLPLTAVTVGTSVDVAA
jgi:UDP-2,3-diacylglucosamine pyrophosphatase LpxH